MKTEYQKHCNHIIAFCKDEAGNEFLLYNSDSKQLVENNKIYYRCNFMERW